MARRLVVLLALGSFLAVASAACDLRPDECDEGAGRCINNVASSCTRPGPEAHADWDDVDCGNNAVCFLGQYGAGCARKDTAAATPTAVSCDSPGTAQCSGTSVVSRCTATKAGPAGVWVDSTCSSYEPVCTADGGYAVDGGVTAGCTIR